MIKQTLIKKCIAAATGFSFMLGIINAPAFAAVWETKKDGLFGVPPSAGNITSAKYYPGSEVIINIQDLHCHGEVQRNIAAILGSIDKKYGLKEVYLEGASGNIETKLLTQMKNKALGNTVMEHMLDSGYLNGTEYYSASEGKSGFITGIEEESVYDKNIGILNKIIRAEDQVKNIVKEMRKEIGLIKKDYANKEIKALDRLTSKYEKGKLGAAKYYEKLIEKARGGEIDVNKYPNIKKYAEFTGKTGTVNNEKFAKEFKTYLEVLKSKLSYKNFAELSGASGNFANIENIGKELIALDKEHGITKDNKLRNLAVFFDYMAFAAELNPLEMSSEEKNLKEEVYQSLGRTIYEREVIYLNEYINTVEGYFTANITSEELEGFEDGFRRFKKVWCSYFSKPAAEKLEKYADMLSEYHRNNVKRDIIFSGKLNLKSSRNKALKKEGTEALREISRELNAGNFKAVVTGGFHSRGLEKIFDEKNISRIVITPRITRNAKDAYEIYKNTVKGYIDIKESTINIRPFMSEGLEISVPKLVASCYAVLERENDADAKIKEEAIYAFIENFLSERKAEKGEENVRVEKLEIENYGSGEMAFTIKFAGEYEEERAYEVKDGKLITKSGSGEAITESGGINPLSIADNAVRKIFRNPASLGYRMITGFAVPVLEESVFRVLPFAGIGLLLGNPLSFIPAALTCIAGIGIFTWAHYAADKAAVKNNPLAQKRNVTKILISSAILTGTYVGLNVLFPAAPFLAAGAVILLHSANNLLSAAGKIKNPVLTILGQTPEQKSVKALAGVIKGLESLTDRYFGESYGANWQLENENKERFTAILEELRNIDASGIGINEKYIALQTQLSDLLDLFSSIDKIGHYEYFIAFKSVLNDVLSPAGNYVYYNGSQKTISEEFGASIENDKIAAVIDGLKRTTRSPHLDIYKTAAEELSKITAETPENERSAVIALYLKKIVNTLEHSDKFLIRKIIPLALTTVDSETNDLIFFTIVELFVKEKSDADKRKENNKTNYDNRIMNLRFAMYDLIGVARPISGENTLKALKKAYDIGIIENDEIPFALNGVFRDYGGVKEYFLTLSDSGVDGELAGSVKKAAQALKDSGISDGFIEESAAELLSLAGIINVSTAPVAEYKAKELLEYVSNMLKNGQTEAAGIIQSVIPLLETIINKSAVFHENTIKALNEVSKYSSAGEVDGAAKFLGYIIDNSSNKRTVEKAVEQIFDAALYAYKNNDIKKARDILEILAAAAPRSREITFRTFKEFPLNEDTLKALLDGFKKSGDGIFSFEVSKRDESIPYSEKITDMLISYMPVLDLGLIANNFYFSGSNGENIALELYRNILSIAENTDLAPDLRILAAKNLGRTASFLYSETGENGIIDLGRINDIFKSLNISYELRNSRGYISYYGDEPPRRFLSYDNTKNNAIFDYTNLISKLPKSIFEADRVGYKNPSYMRISGKTDKKNPQIARMIKDFETLQDILKNNFLALERTAALTSKSTYKDIDSTFAHIEEMIKGLAEISPEHAEAAKISLNNISAALGREGITEDFSKKWMRLSAWEEDSIADIMDINSLINAVHQTSISKFKEKITDFLQTSDRNIRTVVTTRDDTQIVGYDLSDASTVNEEILSLFEKLSYGKMPIGDFVFMEDILVWTTMLFHHSVDIFFNFGQEDRGISVYYHESGRSRGNAERVRYFTDILERFGFSVKTDMETGDKPGTCGLNASLNKDSGMTDETDMIEAAYQAITLFKYSMMLDWELEEELDRSSSGYEQYVYQELIDKFLAGEIWYGYKYKTDGRTAFMDNMLTERPENPGYWDASEFLSGILEALELERMPARSVMPRNLEQSQIDKHFNNPIERAFAEGSLILNENGELTPNREFGERSRRFINVLFDNETESLMQSRTLNLVGKAKFSYKTSAMMGNFNFVRGVYKLKGGNYLSVEGLLNNATGRMKYALTELVSSDGKRTKLTNAELTALLNAQGHKISGDEQAMLGERERVRMLNSLQNAYIDLTDSPQILATGTSEGNGTYVYGTITFDRKNVKPGDILVVPYTEPEDMSAIETASAIITTGGGVLSHAAITTRELRKPSVLLNNAAIKNTENGAVLETECYQQYGDIEFLDHDVKARSVQSKDIVLKEGDRVLVNGETGKIILFGNIDDTYISPQELRDVEIYGNMYASSDRLKETREKIERLKKYNLFSALLDELQSYIITDNAAEIRNFLNEHRDDENIGRFTEYIYFQAIGDSRARAIMSAMFSQDIPESVRTIVRKLNKGYVQEKTRTIRDALNALDSAENIGTAYDIAETAAAKLNFIKTTEINAAIEDLKDEVRRRQKEIKDKMLVYIDQIAGEINGYLSKQTLDSRDVSRIVKMLRRIGVYDYYVSVTEPRKDLRAKRTELVKLSALLDKKVKEFIAARPMDFASAFSGFENIYEKGVYTYGSKTTELALLSRLLADEKGVVVPQGIGISSDMLGLLFEELSLKDEFDALNAGFEKAVLEKNKEEAKKYAAEIQAFIDKSLTKIPPRLLKAIAERMRLFADRETMYSVRSSGVGEDGDKKAFAGMGKSLLNQPYRNIFPAILEVCKSFYEEKSVEYMVENGKIIQPAVLVQEMAKKVASSGVIFSRDKYGRMIIESSYGLGEIIVSGIQTPDSMLIDWETGEVMEYSVADKRIKAAVREDGSGTREVLVTDGRQKRILDDDTIKRISGIVKILEEDAGYPVDIEFSTDDEGTIYILQRRAITTNRNIDDVQAQYKNAKTHITLAAGSAAGDEEAFVNIAHPENDGISIPVYFKKTSGDVIVFGVSEEYKILIDEEILLPILLERINSDPVVLDKLNKILPVNAAVKSGDIGMLPFYESTTVINGILTEPPSSTKCTSRILSAA
ncbi:MAG: hypothetical protein LBR69_03355 [Endomicrobium sp.]|jgi:phosphohistidine swiveling domain-containing protein|nr:hypothetical protein [Endomicrobium sp.]